MNDLLRLLVREGAEELRLVSGAPPAIVLRGKPRPVDASNLTPDELESLLHSISTEGQCEELQKCGDIRFVCTRDSARFAVTAAHRGGGLLVTVRNLER